MIIIYVSTMNFEMRQSESFELNKAIENYFITPTFTTLMDGNIVTLISHF
jgi:hypothetical protein